MKNRSRIYQRHCVAWYTDCQHLEHFLRFCRKCISTSSMQYPEQWEDENTAVPDSHALVHGQQTCAQLVPSTETHAASSSQPPSVLGLSFHTYGEAPPWVHGHCRMEADVYFPIEWLALNNPLSVELLAKYQILRIGFNCLVWAWNWF